MQEGNKVQIEVGMPDFQYVTVFLREVISSDLYFKKSLVLFFLLSAFRKRISKLSFYPDKMY